MTDRVRRDARQSDRHAVWPLGTSREVALRLAEQVIEKGPEARVPELPPAAREEDRFVVAELLQLRAALGIQLRTFTSDVTARGSQPSTRWASGR